MLDFSVLFFFKYVLQFMIHLQTQCMYVWIDGTGEGVRAKTKTVDFVPTKASGECILFFKGDFNVGS